MPPSDRPKPFTREEHRKAYREHHQRAVELYLDCALMVEENGNGGDLASAARFAKMLEEYHEELACMAYHFTASRLLEEMGQ